MGRLQTSLTVLVMVAGAALAGPGTSTPTAPVPVPTPSLPSISWTIEPASSPGEGTVYRLAPTPPASQCVGDANGNGIGDVVDIQATAAGPGCVQYLPIVAENWRRPWYLLLNAGFEEGFAHWSPGHYPPGSGGSETIVGEGCRSGQCLQMQHNDATWQGTRQQVGQLTPGEVYTLTAAFKTAFGHDGYINLYDRSWGKGCGGSGKSFTSLAGGSGRWQDLSVSVRIPAVDDCGDSTVDDDWWVYLYGHHPVTDNSPIFYDEVTLTHDGVNLLHNPSFEEGLDSWLPGSYVPPDQVLGTQVLTPGAWHTVGLVYQRPTLRLYVDGEQEAEADIDLIDFQGYGTYVIGAPGTTTPSGLFRGYLDDLFLADRALTPAQVRQYHTTLHKTLTLPGATGVACVVVGDGGYARAEENGP